MERSDAVLVYRLALCLAWALPSGVGHAQVAAVTTTAILRESIRYLAVEIVKSPVTVDPRVLDESNPLSWGDGRSVRSSSDLAGLASPGTSVLATLDRAIECQNPTRPQCKTNGRATFVRLGTPIVRGDSAKLIMFSRSAKDMTPKDSADIRARHIRGEAAVRQPGYRGPPLSIYDSTSAFARLSSAVGGVHMELSLVRVDGNWKVVAHKILGQS
jgi:hypothetical protein